MNAEAVEKLLSLPADERLEFFQTLNFGQLENACLALSMTIIKERQQSQSIQANDQNLISIY